MVPQEGTVLVFPGPPLTPRCPPAPLPGSVPRLSAGQQPARTSSPAAGCCGAQPAAHAQSRAGAGSKQYAGLQIMLRGSGHMFISTSCATHGKRLF